MRLRWQRGHVSNQRPSAAGQSSGWARPPICGGGVLFVEARNYTPRLMFGLPCSRMRHGSRSVQPLAVVPQPSSGSVLCMCCNRCSSVAGERRPSPAAFLSGQIVRGCVSLSEMFAFGARDTQDWASDRCTVVAIERGESRGRGAARSRLRGAGSPGSPTTRSSETSPRRRCRTGSCLVRSGRSWTRRH